MQTRSSRPPGSTSRRARQALRTGTGLALLATSVVACGGDDDAGGRASLTWYANPDGDQAAVIAANCNATSDTYRINVEVLPQSATEQRIQLARRLAAEDASIDLMSLDPVFTAEFSDAGFLEPMPADLVTELTDTTLGGAIEGATWEGELVVAPQWANTQLLWYRKSFADEIGLDMTQPVTWDQIIDAAAENGRSVGVQANRYEGYIVWINALIQGAGGTIVSDTENGADLTVDLDSEPAREAARIVAKLAASPAAQSDLSVSNEGTVLGPFGSNAGAFQVNWTFISTNYAGSPTADDLGFTRYPQTIEGQESKPPIGGINIGVSAYGGDTEAAYEAVGCITSAESQVAYAIGSGNMPARSDAYDSDELNAEFPPELLQAFRDSIDTAGPRPATPYWSTVVNAMLGRWHPADRVDEGTPASSATFVRDVLDGNALN